MVTLTLTSQAFTLVLDIEQSGWCRVSLGADGGGRDLGADDERIVVERLVAGLQEPMSGSPRWVLSLAEAHTSLYVEAQTDSLLLHVQGADGRRVFLGRLSLEERDLWVDLLKAHRDARADLAIDPEDAYHLATHPPFVVYNLLHLAPAVLSSPSAVFRGLRDAGDLTEGWSFVGHPPVAYNARGAQVAPPAGMCFMVFVSPDGYVFDWDWVPEAAPAEQAVRFGQATRPIARRLVGTNTLTPGTFVPVEPWYSRRGDCVFCYFSAAESYADRVSGDLTVFRSLADHQATGFKIKAIRKHIQELPDHAVDLSAGGISVLLLLTLTGRVLIEQDVRTWTLLLSRLGAYQHARVAVPRAVLEAPREPTPATNTAAVATTGI